MEYQVIHEFLSCTHEGKDIMQRMVIVQDERGVCVTSEEEWRKIWGSQHPERWKNQQVCEFRRQNQMTKDLNCDIF